MTTFFADLEQIFSWLLAASWQASVLTGFILLLQRSLGTWLNPRWRSALWLLVLVRLVLPVLPESSFSLFQYTPPPPDAITVSVTTPFFVSAPTPIPEVPPTISTPTASFSLYSLLAMMWLLGALSLLIITVMVNRRFAQHVKNSPAISDHDLLQVFTQAKAELGIHRTIRLIENSRVQSPAIMGLFQPTLLLPLHARTKFDAAELRFIFLHELAHLQRGDIILQALIAALQILHWFNPVLWFAFRRMRIDREPATDALVLSRTGESEKERYGLMLIKLLEHFHQRHSLPTLVGILEDKDQFKRRFSLIAKFTRGAYGWSLLGVVLIGVLAAAFLTRGDESHSIYSVKKNIPSSMFYLKENFNPFYFALPFNDTTYPDLAKIWVPANWNKSLDQKTGSACLGHWVKITNQTGISCYAQWEDFGPGVSDDPDYVFGDKPPKYGKGTGIDLSPATAAFLGIFGDKNPLVSWQFVDEREVPAGPWFPRRVIGHWKLVSGSIDQINVGRTLIYLSPKTDTNPNPPTKFLMVNPDGTFVGEQIIPGDYVLSSAISHSSGSVEPFMDQRNITIPPKSSKDPDAPFDLGEIKVGLDTDKDDERIELESRREIFHFDHLNKVQDMPLDEFIEKINQEFVAQNPKKQGLGIILNIPPHEAPLRISYDFTPYRANIELIFSLLRDCYPIDYHFDKGSVYIRQQSKFEIAFYGKARTTKIDIDFDNVTASSALRMVQQAAVAKGFNFSIYGLEVLIKLDALQPNPITLHAKNIDIAQALRSICYLGNLSGNGQRQQFGYEVSRAAPEAVAANVFVSLESSFVAYPVKLDKNEGAQVTWTAYPKNVHATGSRMPAASTLYYTNSLEGPKAKDEYPFRMKIDATVINKSSIHLATFLHLSNAQGQSVGDYTGQWTASNGHEIDFKAAGLYPLPDSVNFATLNPLPPVGTEFLQGYQGLLTATLVNEEGDLLLPPPTDDHPTSIQLLSDSDTQGARTGFIDSTKDNVPPVKNLNPDEGRLYLPPQKAQISVSFILAEMNDDLYLAHQSVIDNSIAKNDRTGLLTFINNRKGISALAAPPVAVSSGQLATIAVTRNLPYATQFDLSKNKTFVDESGTAETVKIPPTPTQFSNEDTGVTAEITPTLEENTVVVNGEISLIELAGTTKGNFGGDMPTFQTTKCVFHQAVPSGETSIFWLPVNRYEEQPVTETSIFGQKTSTTKIVKKRLLLFLKAEVVK